MFKDPRNTVRGKTAYRRLFKAIRVIGRICFSPIYIRVRPTGLEEEILRRLVYRHHVLSHF